MALSTCLHDRQPTEPPSLNCKRKQSPYAALLRSEIVSGQRKADSVEPIGAERAYLDCVQLRKCSSHGGAKGGCLERNGLLVRVEDAVDLTATICRHAQVSLGRRR
jgi:hypothetical protein